MQVRVLGPFEVDGPHGPCVVAGARQRTVLAVLALHAGRPVAIGRLIDTVWPDDPPPSARNSLQSHVTRLRAVLPDGVVRHEPAGYRLVLAPEQVDALCFERLLSEARSGAGPAGKAELLDRALALWRGPALPEFPSGPLAGWAARLGAAHRTAVADRAELGGGSGRLAAEVAADPCWERGALVLARMLPAAEATAVLRGHAEAVVEALGLDPSPAVRELQAQLARGNHRPAAHAPGAGVAAAGTGTARMDAAGGGIAGAHILDAAGAFHAEEGQDPPRADQGIAGAPIAGAADADRGGADRGGAGRGGEDADGVGGAADPGLSPAVAQRPGDGPEVAWSRRDVAVGVPRYVSSFLGREGERAALLAGDGLVTVAGPGGVGKTRLVAEAVRDLAVAWVDAAAVRGGDDFLQAVAAGTGARPAPGDDVIATITAACRSRSGGVLVLDNCEHVLAPAAEVVEAILAAAPGTRIIVTSQERLRIDGERVLVLPPLSPDAAAALFADRAAGTVDLGDPAQAAAVGAVVEALDALPLAIELAATQASALGVANLRDRLNDRLDDRLDLLIRGRRTGEPRQRTLRSVVDWSFGLLGADEQRVLVRLGVFAGPFTVALAEAVVADATLPRSHVARALAALVDRSLVSRAGPGRFRLLETVRAYVRQQPAAGAGELHRRHAEAVVAATEVLDLALRGPREAEAARDLDALLPDLRQAVETARDDPALIARLAAAVYRYGYHGQRYEVLAWGYAATSTGSAGALAAAATHAWGRGDLTAARELLAAAPPHPAASEVLGDIALVSCDGEAALTHYRAMTALAADGAVRASGLACEALVLAWTDQPEQAVALGAAAVDVADLTGNPTARAIARYALGEALGDLDPPRAVALLDEAATLARSVDSRLFVGASMAAAVAIGPGTPTRRRRCAASARCSPCGARRATTPCRWSRCATWSCCSPGSAPTTPRRWSTRHCRRRRFIRPRPGVCAALGPPSPSGWDRPGSRPPGAGPRC